MKSCLYLVTSCSQCNITLGFYGFQQLCLSISESRSLFYKAALYPKAQKSECIPTKRGGGRGGVSRFAQQNIRFQNNHYLFLKSIILLFITWKIFYEKSSALDRLFCVHQTICFTHKNGSLLQKNQHTGIGQWC